MNKKLLIILTLTIILFSWNYHRINHDTSDAHMEHLREWVSTYKHPCLDGRSWQEYRALTGAVDKALDDAYNTLKLYEYNNTGVWVDIERFNHAHVHSADCEGEDVEAMDTPSFVPDTDSLDF